jgi:hypothetical protein
VSYFPRTVRLLAPVTVGDDYGVNGYKHFIDACRGGVWTPTGPVEDAELIGVTCVAVRSCVTVGDFFNEVCSARPDTKRDVCSGRLLCRRRKL